MSLHTLLHQPGEAWVYGPATDVVELLIEGVSGQPFEVFLQTRVLEPLKMRDTVFEVSANHRSRHRCARQTDGALRAVAPKSRQHPPPSGAGGLFSTPTEYVRFGKMLLNGGPLEGLRVLSLKALELMTQDPLPGRATPTKIYPVSDGFGLGVAHRCGPQWLAWFAG